MSPAYDSTIAAIATASGPAGVSILRISGRDAWKTARAMVALPACLELASLVGRFRHVRILHPRSGEEIDDGLILVFQAPNSYTGEDTVELHGHGGNVAARRLLEAALAAGAQMARPGEFTRRAFLNNRIDLAQAEAVVDLIMARTDRAAQAARMQLQGNLSSTIDRVYKNLMTVSADIEALLDFNEDEVPDGFIDEAAGRLQRVRMEIIALSGSWHTGRLLREGALVVISGRPNVGKSSLMNALLGSDRAIVSDIPGTTRDSIEESIAIAGIPVRLVDTAGLRSTGDIIEAEGVSRADELITQADLNLHMIDNSCEMAQEDIRLLSRFSRRRTLLVLNKSDLAPKICRSVIAGWNSVEISATKGYGLSQMKDKLADLLGLDSSAPMGGEVAARHRRELDTAADAIGIAVDLLSTADPESLVLAAQQMQEAALALGTITGRVWSQDLLDTIFSRFCVGK